MSINMRILPVRDEEIERIAADLRELDGKVATKAATELYDNWREIDYVLGGHSFLTEGHVVLKRSTSEPVHAIRSTDVPALAAQLDAVSDDDIRTRLGAEQMRAAGIEVSDYHNVENMLRDILPAMYGLRSVVTRAAAEKCGLVIWRYDWM